MRSNLRRRAILVVVVTAAFGFLVQAQNKDKQTKETGQSAAVRDDGDEQAIRNSAEAFVKAYNAHDAKAVAALFALKAEFIEEDGTFTKGREAIEQSFAELFAEHPQAAIEVEPGSIRILTPNIAVEEGVVRGTPDPDGPDNVSSYTAVHVKVEGQWLVASVRDFEASAEDLTPHDHLQALAWLVGEWIDESPDSVVHSRCEWADNENFLLQEFQVQIENQFAMGGNMRIGWDPVMKQFKSWVFDSEGGFTEGLWIREEGEWVVKAQGVTGAGETSSSTNVYRLIDSDTIGWRSRERIVDGELSEDIDEVIVKRKPPPPAN